MTGTLVLFALFAATPSTVALDSVRVWEETVVLPTYPLGPEDVNPHFRELEGTVIYPYTMQDNLTSKRVDETYRAWFLENEYLKLMCLPEIGGRIQYVYDKRRGEEMFYHNRVIRPGLIALRGAWVSGGIEWNRGPQGHTVTSFSPVDVIGVSNEDGSASLLIGATEMNFRTRWEVRLTLHPGRTYLDEAISLENPTDGFHPYYFWNNTAFPNRPGTRFIFPMTLGSDHDGKTFFSWPIHEGKDLTWLRNYEEPTSVFAYRAQHDFFGAYDVDRDYGVVQVANHHVLPGKKAWTWGQSDAGLASESVLTDEDGPYIEVQSGPLHTQADFATLAPGQRVSWREHWFPVFDLGQGFEYATTEAAFERVPLADGFELRIHPTGVFEGAEIEIGTVRQRVTLRPEETTRVFVPGPPDASLDVLVRTASGGVVASYRSPLEIPLETEPELDEPLPVETAEDAFLLGQDRDRKMDREGARNFYERALAMDGEHYDSHVALGVLDLESGKFEDASLRFERAIARDSERGMAHYLAGVAALELERFSEAEDHGYAASRRSGTEALGMSVAGRAQARMGRFEDALTSFESARGIAGSEERLLVAAYAAGQTELAARWAREAIDSGTLSLVPRAVLALSGATSLEAFSEEAKHYIGEDAFMAIELGLAFADLGLRRDARRVLIALAPADRVLPRHYLAYWARASSYVPASVDYEFPSRPEAIRVLEQVEDELSLGNLYAGLGRFDDAVLYWRRAAEARGASSVAFRNLAMVAWKRKGDLSEAARWLETAIDARPEDQTLYRDLARVLLDDGKTAKAIETLERVPENAARRADVTLLLARAYVAATRFDDAIALLGRTRFSNREGDSGTWQVHEEAHVGRALEKMAANRPQQALSDFEAALTYPVNLNVGRPAHPREARALFGKAQALEALGKSDEALQAFRACAANDPSTEVQRDYIERCRGALSRP